jgi:cell division septation protein DedD
VSTLPYRQLPLSRLGHLIPPLIEGQTLVALVPTTADLVWAAKAAWDIARIAARREGGRRVALVDLWIEEPALHQTVGLTPGDGIVDAFEYGVSLNKAAREVDGVFFIGAGSYTASAGDLYAHPRWRKLQAGFHSEGALLLLFLSAAGLARLSAVADGAIVLAPEGLDPVSAAGGGDVGAALQRGVPLLGVARDRWMPSATPILPPVPLPTATDTAPPSRRRRAVRAAAAALALVGAVGAGWGGWALFAGGRETLTPSPPTRPRRPPAAAESSRVERARPAPVAAVASADTLPWTIQLAAYGSLDNALAHADRLTASAKILTLVTPVPQSGRAVWYRVLAGSYRTRAAAAAARDTLWRRGVTPRGIGDLLRAPYSFVPPAGESLEGLRRRGVPAVRWPATDRVLVGAFQTREQAAFTEAALKRAGVRANLLPRVGTRP